MTSSLSYASSVQLTMTLASLAHSLTVGWASAAVDNSSNAYMDAILQVRFKLLTGTPGSDQAVYIYVYGSEDGTNYTDGNITGSSASLTLRAPTNMTLLQTVYAATSGALTYISQPVSVALAFNGMLPRKWGVVLRNTTNLAFSATEADHYVKYTGIKILNT